MRWTDNHCHLPPDQEQAAGLVVAAAAAGVHRIINVGTDVGSSESAAALAAELDGIWATAGIHPHDASTVWRSGGDPDLTAVEALLGQDRVVAVGECGLDYYYDQSPREQQRDVFAAQVALAHRYGVTLVIHSREAWDDTFAILEAEGVPERTVFHCFTGGPAEARRCLDLGALLSFSGIVTFPNAQEVAEAACFCPLDRLVVETDAPYLAPVPNRGQRNQPAWVPLVGAAIAALRGIPVEEVADATWETASRLYGLDV
ncbi:MAG: TatD family hydrolase [Acidimicrobiales bacterium]|nr:TatD family hydrolase [Acidimicrobiales bacterium]